MRKNIKKKKRHNTRLLAKEVAVSASALKAVDIKVLNLSGLASFTDYFVICGGTSARHVRSITDRVLLDQKKKGNPALGVEGYDSGEWVLIDFGGVVAHFFQPSARRFYNIERFWGDAKRVSFRGIK